MIYNITHATLLVCWLAFLIYWMVNARKVKQTVEKGTFGSRFAFRWPIYLAILIYFFSGPRLLQEITPTNEVLELLGAAVCVFGLVVAIWARRTLAGNWSSNVTFKQDHELIQNGPYQYVRHPIYTGLLLMALGAAITNGTLRSWISLFSLGLGFWIKLNQEEALMLRHFPDQYPAYQARTKALIPFLV